MNALNLTRLYPGGGIIATYRCSARCGHCLYACSPTRSGAYLQDEEAREVFHYLRAHGAGSVHIGGGEPCLNFERLTALLRAAREAQVSVDYLETNASWYRGRERTEAQLRRLMEAGLDTLMVSISPYHAAYVPLDKMLGVLSACYNVDLPSFTWMDKFAPELNCMGARETHGYADFAAQFGEDYWRALPGRYGLTLNGRALYTHLSELPRHPVERIQGVDAGCVELGSAHHFHVDPERRYIPGSCTGLALALEALDRPVREEAYPLVTLLYQRGVGALYRLCVREYGFVPDPAGYASKCHLCLSLRAHLVKRRLPFAELHPLEYYQEVAAPPR